MKKRLNTMELKDVLKYQSEDSDGVTDELFGIGKMLMAEGLDRTKQLDAKAMSLTGYGAVILALLVSAFSNRAPTITPAAWAFIVLAGWVVGVAIAYSLRAVWIAKYHWFSDKDWFGAGMKLESTDKLKRFHLLAMHHVRWEHEDGNDRKAKLLRQAYAALAVGGGLLAAALLIQAVVAFWGH